MGFIRNNISRLIAVVFAFFVMVSATEAKNFVVVLDAGHGGNDPGAVGPTVNEKDVNLKVTQKLGDLLKKELPLVKVVYTRSNDRFIDLNDRCRIANNESADLFISIHCDSSEKNRCAEGATVFYPLSKPALTPQVQKAKKEESNDSTATVAEPIVDPATKKVINQSEVFGRLALAQLRNVAGRSSRGVTARDLLVLQYTKMPAVLVELDFICNADQEGFLASDDGQTLLAGALCNAVKQYVTGDKKSKIKTKLPTKEEVIKKTKPASDKEKETNVMPSTPAKNKDKDKTTPAENNKPNTSAGKKCDEKTTSGEPIYKVQFLTSGRELSDDDPRFKGLVPHEFYIDNKTYKYTFGAEKNIKAANKILEEVRKLFPDAFIITIKDGERIK